MKKETREKLSRGSMSPSDSEKSDQHSHHANCNNLLIGVRGFSSNGARTSQVLNPKTIVLPDDVSDDVPVTVMKAEEDRIQKTRVKAVKYFKLSLLLYESRQPMIYRTWTLHLPLHGDNGQHWWS